MIKDRRRAVLSLEEVQQRQLEQWISDSHMWDYSEWSSKGHIVCEWCGEAVLSGQPTVTKVCKENPVLIDLMERIGATRI